MKYADICNQISWSIWDRKMDFSPCGFKNNVKAYTQPHNASNRLFQFANFFFLSRGTNIFHRNWSMHISFCFITKTSSFFYVCIKINWSVDFHTYSVPFKSASHFVHMYLRGSLNKKKADFMTQMEPIIIGIQSEFNLVPWMWKRFFPAGNVVNDDKNMIFDSHPSVFSLTTVFSAHFFFSSNQKGDVIRNFIYFRFFLSLNPIKNGPQRKNLSNVVFYGRGKAEIFRAITKWRRKMAHLLFVRIGNM